MTPAEKGFAFSTLLHYRMITDNPQGRQPRPNEIDACRILSEMNEWELRDFREFLNAQGMDMRTIDGFTMGLVSRPGITNKFHVLHRKRGEALAPYFDTKWFITAMTDNRREENKAEVIFWLTRLWLTLQWHFYEKISRHPGQISSYDRTRVTEAAFRDTVIEGIEALGAAGKPDGEAGVMWDVFWKSKKKTTTWVKRFFRVMEQAGIIEETSVKGEYSQTLAASVDMAVIADRELLYLMPPQDESEIEEKSVMLLTGVNFVPSITREANDAVD